eukprot:2558186-Rhodomonas_salina.1
MNPKTLTPNPSTITPSLPAPQLLRLHHVVHWTNGTTLCPAPMCWEHSLTASVPSHHVDEGGVACCESLTRPGVITSGRQGWKRGAIQEHRQEPAQVQVEEAADLPRGDHQVLRRDRVQDRDRRGRG